MIPFSIVYLFFPTFLCSGSHSPVSSASSLHLCLHNSPLVSLKFWRSMANRIRSLNYTPEEPPALLCSALLILSHHRCSLILFALFFLALSLISRLQLCALTCSVSLCFPCFPSPSLDLSSNGVLWHWHLSLCYTIALTSCSHTPLITRCLFWPRYRKIIQSAPLVRNRFRK